MGSCTETSAGPVCDKACHGGCDPIDGANARCLGTDEKGYYCRRACTYGGDCPDGYTCYYVDVVDACGWFEHCIPE